MPNSYVLIGWTLVLAGQLSAQTTARSHSGPRPDSTVIDLYEKGIKTAELIARGTNHTIRRRDRATAAWSAPAPVTLDSLADGSARLPGALAFAATVLPDAERQSWDGRWVKLSPSKGRVRTLERHGKLEEKVGDTTAVAYYWTQVGGGVLLDGVTPVDWIVAPGNVIIAVVDPSGDNVLVRRGYEAFTTVKLWSDKRIPKGTFGYRKLPRAMVPMSDGVKLATDIYLPAGQGAPQKVPVIFLRTPYGIDGAISGMWFHVARGYAFVAQDVRGRFASEGKWEYLTRKTGDGNETLTWITQQPWSDGNIGMTGGSYSGMTQWMTATQGHPALKALIPVSSMGTPHVDMPYTGGAFTEGSSPYMFGMCAESDQAEAARQRARTDWPTVLKARPWIDLDRKAIGRDCEYWDFRITHSIYDEGWKRWDWYQYADKINVPALHLSGWYDDDFPGTLANWAMMIEHHRPHQKLILSAWRHGQNADRELNGVDLGLDVIRADRYVLMERWYDRFLKGIKNGVDEGPAVEYYTDGDGTWRTSNAWPPAESKPVKWYWHSDGSAATSMTTGVLSTALPQNEPPDAYRYDPENPAPSLINHTWNEQTLPNNYREVDARPDVVAYTSAPLTEDLEVAGNVSAVLYASTSARDTDWFVRLADVDPNDNSIKLCEGLIRARHRESFEQAKLVTPGETLEYHIGMRAVGHVFKTGHRIRISVTSSAEGYIFPNSNTGEDEPTVTRTVVAEQQVFHGGAHASYVSLPIVKSPDRNVYP